MDINWSTSDRKCQKEGEELLEQFNLLEHTAGFPKIGTYLYAVTRKMPREFRYGGVGCTDPFIILVRDGEYVCDVHSVNLAEADIRFESRCGYYNIYTNGKSWKEIISMSSDRDEYLNPCREKPNYSNCDTCLWLKSMIQKLRALRCLEHVVIELREDCVIVPCDFKNVYIENKNPDYVVYGARRHYVNCDYALTFPEDVIHFGPCMTQACLNAQYEYRKKKPRWDKLFRTYCNHRFNLDGGALMHSFAEYEDYISYMESKFVKRFPKPEKSPIHDGEWFDVKVIRK